LRCVIVASSGIVLVGRSLVASSCLCGLCGLLRGLRRCSYRRRQVKADSFLNAWHSAIRITSLFHRIKAGLLHPLSAESFNVDRSFFIRSSYSVQSSICHGCFVSSDSYRRHVASSSVIWLFGFIDGSRIDRLVASEVHRFFFESDQSRLIRSSVGSTVERCVL